MGLGTLELILILVIVFVLFGAGKLPKVMGDIGKGIRHLKEGLKGENHSEEHEKKELTHKDHHGK